MGSDGMQRDHYEGYACDVSFACQKNPTNRVGKFPMDELYPTQTLQATIRDGENGVTFELYAYRKLTGLEIEREIALYSLSMWLRGARSSPERLTKYSQQSAGRHAPWKAG